MSYTAVKSATAFATVISSPPSILVQNRNPSTSSAVNTVPPLQGISTRKLSRNFESEAIVSGMHSSMAEKYADWLLHAFAIRIPAHNHEIIFSALLETKKAS